MDYFFAQVEERENPRFSGKPLVVGAEPKEGRGRGVVSTCNYEARKYKIRSGMPISRAYKNCPDATFLPVNMKLYEGVSENISRIIESVTKNYEKVSLDEAYLDIKEIAKNYSTAERIGSDLKKLILERESLTCSVGVGENKMIAKIASESEKPDGLVIVKPCDSSRFIVSRSIREIPGIGPKTEKRLQEILSKGNLTVKDVRSISKEQLNSVFGKRGEDIYNRVRGVDDSQVVSEKKAKSIGREETFDKDTLDPEKIINTFRKIVAEVAEAAIEEDRKVKSIVVVCRSMEYETHTRQVSFGPQVIDFDFLYKKGVRLLLHLLTENSGPIRLIGVRVLFAVDD